MHAGTEQTAISSGHLPSADFEELLARLFQEREGAHRRIEELTDEIKHLRWRIEALNQKLYGRSSEKIDPAQLVLELAGGRTLDFEAAVQQAAALASSSEPKKAPRKGHGRGRLPAHLPRIEIVHELPPEKTCCETCQGQMDVIGEEVSEQLDFVPAHLVVNKNVRKMYACLRCHDAVVTAPAPPAPIEKGLPGPGLLAQVAIAKYADHTPLYRMERIFARSGVDLDRNTLGGWVAASAGLLRPIVDVMKFRMLQNWLLQSDDTPVRVLDGKNPSWTGRLWVYGTPEGEVVFEFTEDRSGTGPLTFLKEFKGVLQADAYSGYDVVFRTLPVIEAGCWAHARRKVFEAQKTDPARAGPLLKAIGDLFEVERQCKELSAEKRHEVRQEKSRPIVEAIEALVGVLETELLPKSPLYGAVGYIWNQRAALKRFGCGSFGTAGLELTDIDWSGDSRPAT